MGTGKIEKYSIHATKCIEQSLEETWFLWLSAESIVRDFLSRERTLTGATDELYEFCRSLVYQTEDMCEEARKESEFWMPQGLVCDLLRKSLDYTDWRRLAKKLCETFTIQIKEK